MMLALRVIVIFVVFNTINVVNGAPSSKLRDIHTSRSTKKTHNNITKFNNEFYKIFNILFKKYDFTNRDQKLPETTNASLKKANPVTSKVITIEEDDEQQRKLKNNKLPNRDGQSRRLPGHNPQFNDHVRRRRQPFYRHIPNRQPSLLRNKIFSQHDKSRSRMDGNKPFSKFKHPIEQMCRTQDKQIGVCVSPKQCLQTNGRSRGRCTNGMYVKTCCMYESVCGLESNQEVNYFRNPGYPKTISNVGSGARKDCVFLIGLLPTTCQVRVDFLDFHLQLISPQGQCNRDNFFQIASSDKKIDVPINFFCGNISAVDSPHLYIHAPIYDVRIIPHHISRQIYLRSAVRNHESRWNIRLSQVHCRDPMKAPSGCAQYIIASQKGILASYNFIDGNYIASNDYTICIKRNPQACGISFTMIDQSFNVGQTLDKGLVHGINCISDYISFDGQKAAFCGNLTVNLRLNFRLSGPIQVRFHSEPTSLPPLSNKRTSNKNKGFRMKYEFIFVCDDRVDFYQFPRSNRLVR